MAAITPRSFIAIATLSALISIPAQGDIWTEPSPWRREALIEGRDFTYGNEAFLQRFSYRHLGQKPLAGEDGVRGTAGSVSSDELFVDIALQKHLYFDDDRHNIFVRMQRFEDFDGRFDQQIVGIGRRIGSSWHLALAGDVTADKAEANIQLEARWQPGSDQLLRLAYIRPDHFFNDKGNKGNYLRNPQTVFLHYRHQPTQGWHHEVAVNYSPEARLDDNRNQLLASGDQLRAMVAASVPVGEARVGARYKMEKTDRDFVWQQSPAPGADSFQRRMYAATLFAKLPQQRFTPEIGVRHFRFEESGWFGTETGSTGKIRRSEPLLYTTATVHLSERQQWQPTIYVSRINHLRQLDQQPASNRDEEEWVGKLALPWRYTVDQGSGAVLTINPTVRLHRAAFGGGNIQLHWPF